MIQLPDEAEHALPEGTDTLPPGWKCADGIVLKRSDGATTSYGGADVEDPRVCRRSNGKGTDRYYLGFWNMPLSVEFQRAISQIMSAPTGARISFSSLGIPRSLSVKDRNDYVLGSSRFPCVHLRYESHSLLEQYREDVWMGARNGVVMKATWTSGAWKCQATG